MLTRVTATEYVRALGSGRTKPVLLTCEVGEDQSVEVVAKFSAGCDQKEINLAREVMSACLAADLQLPVPQPYLVETTPDWVETVPELDRRKFIRESCPIAFGSKLVTGQYSAWVPGSPITNELLPATAAIFVFDAIVQNPDRREENPNCLVRGNNVRIFDHELTFAHGVIIGWRPPWVAGSLNGLERPGQHIFRQALRGREIDFDEIQDAWSRLTDERIESYSASVPREWSVPAQDTLERAVTLIKGARDNIGGCIAEVRRVLT